MLASYEDLEAPGLLLYHRPGIKEAINIKEEDWELLLVADPRCILEIETALHEFVYRFSLYNNRVESPERGWEDLLADIKAYRQERWPSVDDVRLRAETHGTWTDAEG